MAKTESLTLRTVKASEISYKEALELLHKQFPKAKVASLEIDPNRDLYIAHVHVAEFPPKKDGGEDEAPEPDDGGSDDDGPEEDSGPEDGSPFPSPEEGEGGSEGGKEDKLDQLLSKIDMICQALGVDPMAGGDLGPGGPPMGGPDLPDIGAPSGMTPDDKPLPPPAMKQQAPMGGGGAAFAKRTVTAWREDDGVTQAEFMKEAKAFFPGYRVAKVERHMGKGANGYEGPVLVSVLVAE